MTETVATRAIRPESWRHEFIRRNKFRCHYCNRRGVDLEVGPDDRPWHIDHMKPLSRGGVDEEFNLALACKRCNLTKGTRPYKDFAQFAQMAFWTPDDWRLSEPDLDELMRFYTDASDIHCSPESKWRANEVTWSVDVIGEDGNPAPVVEIYEPPLEAPGYDRYLREARAVLGLIELMHEKLPALVAEIRMLRSTEREAAM